MSDAAVEPSRPAAASVPPPPSPSPRRWVRIVRASIALPVLAAIVGVLSIEAFAWLLPQDFTTHESKWYGRAITVSFFARVFQFHAALGVLIASLIVLWMRWWRSALVAAIAGLTLMYPFARTFVPKAPPTIVGPKLRVMAMNLYFLNRDEDAILRAINDADPDVIVMPEATDWSGREIIGKHLSEKYRYLDLYPPGNGSAVIISRVPFRRDEPAVRYPDRRQRVPLVFTLGDRELTMYGVHLVSPGRRWLVEVNRAQTELLGEIRKAEKRPVLIAGDFNFTQLTPNYEYLHNLGFRSSHEIVGFGLGNTWGPKWSWMNMLPGVQIDHILLTPELTAVTHRVGIDDGSDHRPIIADIGFVAPAAAQK